MKCLINLRKSITTVIMVLIFVLSFASCNTNNKQEDQNSGNGDNNDNNIVEAPSDKEEKLPNDNAVWGNGIFLRVVVADGSDYNLSKIITTISTITETPAFLVTDIIDESEHEFIIGETDRELSKTAYSELYKRFDSDFDDGWLIYAEGNSMALAYTSDVSYDMSMEYIEEELLTKEEFVIEKDGVVSEHVYDAMEFSDARRETVRQAAFDRIEMSLGKDIADALKKLYSMYDADVYKWLAALYDPGVGGFYFSNSGRDNAGYLPDIESTVQPLNHLNTSKMFANYDDSYVNALSEQTKAELLAFAKNLQSSEDGYFYHPQWGKNIIVARRGRDLGWATQLIKSLGGIPYWNTPGGVTGEFGAPSAVASASALTKRLSSNIVSSVASVKASAQYLPDYLKSLDAWKIYIDRLNIYKDPYTAGNTLSAQHNEIKAAGKEYIDYLINYLDDLQDENTGFWGEGVTYVTMNGFMKISSSYAYYGRAVPNVEAALYSTIEILLTPDTSERDLHVCNTYNTWVNFSQILSSAKKTSGDEGVKALRAVILEKAPELISITYDKLSTHQRDDGGFAYFETKNCYSSQSAPIACAIEPESDVNATCIATTGIISNLFSSLGVSSVPMYCDVDCIVFLKLIENREPVQKPELDIELPELSGERGMGNYFNVSNKYVGSIAPLTNNSAAVAVVSNTDDKYVYFYKDISDGEENLQSSLDFSIPSSRPQGSAGIVFELDVAFGGFSNHTSETKAAGLQINILDGERFASVYFDGDNGKIATTYSNILDGKNINLNENTWYNLRFETIIYNSTRAIKIYVDGEYACTVKTADEKATSSKKVSITLRQFETDDWVAFDNVYASYYS